MIACRQATPALQSYSDIDFIQAEYPLVYRRKSTDGKSSVLVIINASNSKKSFETAEGKIIHITGGSVIYSNGLYILDSSTAVYIEEK